jgi:DNA-directed RNA polymerase specialized sigma24 family protein
MDLHSERHDDTQSAGTERRRKFLLSEPDGRDRELLSRLSDKHRTLLLAEGSYKELAHQFGVPLGTVRSRLHRARARLQLLRQEGDQVKLVDKTSL